MCGEALSNTHSGWLWGRIVPRDSAVVWCECRGEGWECHQTVTSFGQMTVFSFQLSKGSECKRMCVCECSVRLFKCQVSHLVLCLQLSLNQLCFAVIIQTKPLLSDHPLVRFCKQISFPLRELVGTPEGLIAPFSAPKIPSLNPLCSNTSITQKSSWGGGLWIATSGALFVPKCG